MLCALLPRSTFFYVLAVAFYSLVIVRRGLLPLLRSILNRARRLVNIGCGAVFRSTLYIVYKGFTKDLHGRRVALPAFLYFLRLSGVFAFPAASGCGS